MTCVFLTFAKPMIRFFTGGSEDAEKTMAMSIACVRNLVCRFAMDQKWFAMDQKCCLSGVVRPPLNAPTRPAVR
jgi:hypothetical protein